MDNAKIRSQSLLVFADLIDRDAAKIVDTIVRDAGKPKFEAELEVSMLS